MGESPAEEKGSEAPVMGASRDWGQGINGSRREGGSGHGTKNKEQRTKNKGQGTRDKGLGTRDKGQGTRDEGTFRL